MKLRYPIIVIGSVFVAVMFSIGLNVTVEYIVGDTYPTLVALLSLPVFLIVGNGLDKPFHDIR